MVIVHAVDAPNGDKMQLLDKNSLYCISTLPIIDHLQVASCYSGSVVWGSNYQFMGTDHMTVQACN
jgi:hypothetical protein